ncbi:hypothetical protein KI387_040766, partial [Taxus chinensis]
LLIPFVPPPIVLAHANTSWSPPPLGWLKLNTDGVAKGNPGASGGGVILRDDSGNPLATLAICFGFGTNHRVEALAILKGIELALSIGSGQLIVESDSLNM